MMESPKRDQLRRGAVYIYLLQAGDILLNLSVADKDQSKDMACGADGEYVDSLITALLKKVSMRTSEDNVRFTSTILKLLIHRWISSLSCFHTWTETSQPAVPSIV
ncbi:hypothetical protein JOB18_036056 [Solea senegalensis]|uniref:Uncharacterized protein n=1 Tax=Solea senegalensis TaxID=28829 RepID=A0AAV6TAQ5_SOLSE|nr:hypothetical protein JOB18_036056 [Solea senegalensis]